MTATWAVTPEKVQAAIQRIIEISRPKRLILFGSFVSCEPGGWSMNQRPKQRVPATSSDWLAHARSDLKLARLGMGQDVLPEQICFHAQQAVEKSLKAVLLFRRIDFPFTHDLEELIETFEHAGVELPHP